MLLGRPSERIARRSGTRNVPANLVRESGMDRYAVYRDISPGYVVFDTLSDTVVALYHDRRDAERAARRLNAPPFIGLVRAVPEADRAPS